MKKKQIPLLIFALFSIVAISMLAVLRDSGRLVNRTPIRQGTSGAMEALTFWTRARAYPHRDISPDKQFQAYQKARLRLKKAGESPDDSSRWRAMGPLNVPGRMISLAVNPQNQNTLYAGAASGGLWRTYTAYQGGNWQRVHTGFPTLGVMAIAIDPTDSNKIFIGTGETYGYQRSIGGFVIRTTRGSYGIGILKTNDGGATWEKSLDWTYHQERGIQCIRINPLNPNTVFAATSEGIYKSVDAGNSWTNVLPVLMGEDIVIHPVDTTKILVSCGNLGSPGSGLYRSFDAGATWNKLSGIPQFSGKTLMDYFRSDPDIVFASVADSLNGIGLYRTDDFGSTWNMVHQNDVPRYQGWFSHWVAVHPTDVSQVVHAGVPIFKSNDGGVTLRQIGGVHVDHHNFAHDPLNPNILYIACDGGVYRSTNFGSSYQRLGNGLQTCQFYNGFSSSASDSNLALGGLQDNGLVIYRGSTNWQNTPMGDGCWTATNTMNDNILYAESQYNHINKSTNRGRSFSSSTSGMSGSSPAFVAPFVISPSDPSILYSGRTRIFKSTNGGEFWKVTNNNRSLDGNPALSMAISATNPDIVYVGTAPIHLRAGIFRTTNGGVTWTDQTKNLPDRYPMDIAIDPEDNNTVYVVFGGFGSGHVFKSTDGGDTWSDVTGSLPDVPTLAVAIDPLNSDHIYVGNDLGVYVSTDAGATWESFNNGLPEAVIAMDLNISPQNRSLRVATHGNGAYQRALIYKPSVYLLLALESIPSTVLLGFELEFIANVTNLGNQPMTDTAMVKLRVIDEQQQELFSDTKTVANLAPREHRQVSFDGKFIPQNPGDFWIQLINLGTASHPEFDTTQQKLTVIMPPTIASATVTKKYCAYQEISGGGKLPFKDDSFDAVALPFVFSYDLYDYDKIQICANGWCEFGTGSAGSERGTSIPSQIGNIGANENGRLASTARPSKALGPWWEDLNPEDSSNPGSVSYATLGSAPNRVFVIQWKNMRAYYDQASTTTRVNFQVRLYETSNIIEFHYGPVVPGTFAGPDIGAMIGFKDHIGGDYHFYDIAGKGMEPASDIVTDLSPLTDWPGPDSCYVIQTLTTGVVQREQSRLPTTTVLYQNYPNPFNPSTTIRYDLPTGGRVSLKIFNTRGQEVKTIVNQVQNAGTKSVVWDGRDNFGRRVTSGVYLCRLSVGNHIRVRKMVVAR